MRIVELEIKNWEKHNPRTDVKTTKWFKMSNEFFNDPEFYGMSLEGRTVWLFLLCTASKKMKGMIKINTQMVADNLRTGVDSIDFAILELERCGSITTQPVTLIPNNFNTIESVRKSALEEKREEKKRGEEKRKEYITTELGVADSVALSRQFGATDHFSKDDEVIKLLKTVPHDSQALWIKTYNDIPWILSEFSKMIIWLNCNPRKAPKSRMNAFISTWLGRSWDNHRKTLPGQFGKPEHRIQSSITDAEMDRARQLGII